MFKIKILILTYQDLLEVQFHKKKIKIFGVFVCRNIRGENTT